jgi:ATP-binding cassette subfamily F protein uup
VKSVALDVTRTGNLVIEAEHVNYAIDGRQLVRDFSCLLTRGDKVGIIGPNGSGKTTLVRLLLGELAPDSGVVRQGTGLSIAYFDQLRRQLDEQETVMRNVGEGSDYVTIQGKEQHVASYLKSFLFTPDRFNQPVSSLSGGERNRLLLAKLFARPVNVLVMDEPTNDLDLETLTLLETMLVDYSGTLLLISHDRAFINQVVTSILVYEADGQFHEYVGGYDTYQARLLATTIPTTKPSVSRTPPVRTKRSFNEERELSQLPIQIETLEKTMASMRMEMSNPAFYKQPTETMTAFHARLMAYETELSTLYARWEILENRG